MKATDFLMDDHRLIERALAALATATVQLEQEVAVRPGFFVGVVEFLDGFVHSQHFRREEGLFFSAMERAGAPRTAGPVAVAIREHEESRTATRVMRSAAERWEAGDKAARQDLAEDARRYVSLVKQHIAREDQLIFPMAEDMVSQEDDTQMFESFDQPGVDGGAGMGQEFYRALVAALEEEVGH